MSASEGGATGDRAAAAAAAASVAIVGVSPEAGSLGGNVLTNLTRIGFQGDIHLVSRNNREIGGRACVGSIDELPAGVDVAVLAVPRQATVDAVQACVRRKIGAALVFASGFAEMDEAGRARRKRWRGSPTRQSSRCAAELHRPGQSHRQRRVNLRAAVISPPYPPPQAGEGREAPRHRRRHPERRHVLDLAAGAAGKRAQALIVVSTGNEAQLTTEHFLAFLIDDDSTEVIVLFMEQVRDPALFLELAARARERRKPIVLMHPGRSARAQSPRAPIPAPWSAITR